MDAPSDTPLPAPRWCPACQRGVDPSSCRVVSLGGEAAWLCGRCGGVTRGVEVRAHTPLLALYRDAWRPVVTHDGLIAAAALGVGQWVIGHFPFVGGILGAGAVLAYVFAVVRHTAAGHDDLPMATDFVHFTDLFAPVGRLLAALLAPGLLVAAALAAPPPLRPVAVALAALVALAWVPGAFASAAWSGGVLEAVNPAPVLALLTRIPRDWALTVAVLWALALVDALVGALAAAVGHALRAVPVLPSLLVAVAPLPLVLVMARVLGILLRERRDEVGAG